MTNLQNEIIHITHDSPKINKRLTQLIETIHEWKKNIYIYIYT